MYSVSNAFHEAVAAGKPQMAMLIFEDTVFTNEDIDVETGIEFNDYFNTEEDIAIGQAPSNEISFTLFNDARLLNDYTFGDFLATIGVVVEESTYEYDGNCRVAVGNNTYVGSTTYPYLRRNGTVVSAQPNFGVKSIMVNDGYVYVFGGNNKFKRYKDSDGTDATTGAEVSAFMKAKGVGLAGVGASYYRSNRFYLDLWRDGVYRKYEFCPLGWFTAERPNVPDTIQIDMHCNDFMMKFDKDMPENSDLGITFPSTIGNLFTKMCSYVDVDYESNTFINSEAVISSRPDEFDTATMRDVLKWIAEAACSILRFNRAGYLVFDWMRTTSLSIDENGYSEFSPYWYETSQISKLYNRNTSKNSDKTVGAGNVGYLIQDNPLLEGVS